MQKSHCFFKVSAIAAGVCFSANTFAAGFQINEVSPTIQATALADAATASGDISGMAFNPATLGTIQGTDIYVAGNWIIPDVGYSNAQGTIYPTTPGGTNVTGVNSQSNITPSALIPSIYMGTNLPYEPDIKVGIGMDVPWGMTTDYDQNWVGQYNAVDSSIKTLNIFPTVAYQVTPKLDLGAAVNFERISASYSNNFYQNIFGITSQGTSILNGSAWAMGYVLGAMYKVTPKTTIGLDYHSPVRETIDGTATISGTCAFGGYNCNSLIPGLGTDNGNVTIKLPATANIGVSEQLTERLTLMAGAQWTQWSTIQAIDADIVGVGFDNTQLSYKNSWLYSLGASYLLTPKWTLMGGVAYDETPTVNQFRDPRIPDTNREWITTGLEYAASKNLSVFGTYEHIFMNDQSISVTQQSGGGAASSKISADYSGYADIVAAGMNYTF